MIAAAFDPSAPRRRMLQPFARTVAAVQRRIADTVLPMRGSHPALGYRAGERI